ncbi:MAG: hypothetical protein AAFX79_04160 [Planctomycetota bacterium]
MQGNEPIFAETQRLHQNLVVRYVVPISCVAVLVFVGGAMLASGAPIAEVALAAAVLLGTPLVIAQLPMRTVVTPREVRVAMLGLFRWRIPMDAIVSVEPAKYVFLRNSTGWGIRPSRTFGLMLTVAGNRGAQLRYDSGGRTKRLLIGSQRADELVEAIRIAADVRRHEADALVMA